MMIEPRELIKFGLGQELAAHLVEELETLIANHPPEWAWQSISQSNRLNAFPFELHLFVFKALFPNWPDQLDSAPVWVPEDTMVANTHLAKCMHKLNLKGPDAFHQWSIQNRPSFWQFIIHELKIKFKKPPEQICDLKDGIESPQWLVGATLNIAESCFNAPPDKTALIFEGADKTIKRKTYAELNQLSNRVANGLVRLGLTKGDAIAINMPMTAEAVAIYLGIIKMGGIVVSIADSFSAEEVAARLSIIQTKAIFTQDVILRDGKTLPLYEKIKAVDIACAIVLAGQSTLSMALRPTDLAWQDFLGADDQFTAVECAPDTPCHVLFSSGTTGAPKAICWQHMTPIKSASDGFFHQDIQSNDTLVWPTNLGWMMGPWAIFATLINQGTLGLYYDIPTKRGFGEFVQNAKVTILGTVPALVTAWHHGRCMEGLNWQNIRLLTSTAECSNPEDMFYLMYLARYKPIIEYCGGTETGGGYITSTLLQKNYPAVFTTPAMGIDFVLIDEAGHLSDDGEAYLVPPSIGLSNTLLNADHHAVYYANVPDLKDGRLLRRHGDHLLRLPSGNYCALGRADDTMKLGGIKVSAVEIERALASIDKIDATAAIAIKKTQFGPSYLVIYAVTDNISEAPEQIKKLMQTEINKHLNPLFKIEDVVFVKELPKTASNKTMRRLLRDAYQKKICSI